jgi:hypothetical protein
MHSEIYRIAYQLNAEGKTPCVALIRGRLTNPTPLPMIIQALQQWKLAPELGKESDTSVIDEKPVVAVQPTDSSSLCPELALRLTVMENKLDNILALLAKNNEKES